MFRVVVLYEREPERDRYREHLELTGRGPGVSITHGPIFGSPAGPPPFRYGAYLDFPDREAFETGTRSPEMRAAAEDAQSFGIPFQILFAEIAPA
jgi:hypothetical protein